MQAINYTMHPSCGSTFNYTYTNEIFVAVYSPHEVNPYCQQKPPPLKYLPAIPVYPPTATQNSLSYQEPQMKMLSSRNETKQQLNPR